MNKAGSSIGTRDGMHDRFFWGKVTTYYTASRISVDQLTFGKIIGSGSFAKVYKGIWRGNTVALKCVRLPHGSDTSLFPTPKEVEVLKLVLLNYTWYYVLFLYSGT